MRTARRSPRACSSATTMAALGPPMPVLWTVSGSAVERDARVAPEAAVMVEHPRRLVEEHARERERLARVVGQQRALGQLGGRVQVRHGGRG